MASKVGDALIVELPGLLWSFYSDAPEGVLNPRQFANDKGPFLERLLLFVRSDLEYRWPPHPRASLSDLFWTFLTGKNRASDERATAFANAGDLAVWPFLNAVEYDALIKNPQRQPELSEGSR